MLSWIIYPRPLWKHIFKLWSILCNPHAPGTPGTPTATDVVDMPHMMESFQTHKQKLTFSCPVVAPWDPGGNTPYYIILLYFVLYRIILKHIKYY